MVEDNKRRVVATIDVGSNVLKMIVAEVSAAGKIFLLEELKKSTHIGRDTFATGKIEVETIHQTCADLQNFVKVMKLYQVENCRAVTTSAIREARNRDYILEQIRLQTGLNVEVINSAQERLLTFKAIRDQIPDHQKFRKEGALIVDIGSGGVEISAYKDGYLKFTEYMKLGAMRIREQMSQLERISLDFPELMEEFIQSKISSLKQYLEKLQTKNFIGLGGELRVIYQLCTNASCRENQSISLARMNTLFTSLGNMSTEQIMEKYDLNYKSAGLLLPSLIIFLSFFQMTEAEYMYTPLISLRHGILSDMVDRWYDTPRKQDFINDTISSVWYIGQKYRITNSHCRQVVKLALSIFDQMMQIHGLPRETRLYLQVAAILHDVGKYINSNQHAMISYNIIRSLDIIGFSDHEMNLIANIARYHADEIPEFFHENYHQLSFRDRIVVSKLSAILKLAESLDVSRKQKIDQLSVFCNDGELHLELKSHQDILLEKWYFASRAVFFEEVMGMKPVLKSKG